MSAQFPLQPEGVDVMRLKTSVRLAERIFTTSQLNTQQRSLRTKFGLKNQIGLSNPVLDQVCIVGFNVPLYILETILQIR